MSYFSRDHHQSIMSRRDIVNELFKPSRVRFPRRHVLLKGIDDIIQFDLADFQDVAKENDSNRYVLCAINCFTKQAYAVAVKNKTAKAVAEAAEKILNESGTRFRLAQTDQGQEFGGAFKTLMERRKIKHYHTFSEMKASIVERFIRTLKTKLHKRMMMRASLRYIDILQSVVDDYNNTYHRTIKMKPNQVTKAKEKFLLETVYKYERPVVKARYSVGDYVRVSKKRFVFTRGFYPSWSAELFRIYRVNPKHPVTYILSNYDGSEIIQGAFYEQELLRTKNKDIFLVDKILKRKGRKVLIRWLGYGPKYDTWENASNILRDEK